MSKQIKSVAMLMVGCVLGATLATQIAMGPNDNKNTPAGGAAGAAGAAPQGGPDFSKMTCPMTGEPMMDVMGQMMKDGAPGEMHKNLAYFAGNWDCTVAHYMPGMKEPMMGKATFSAKAAHGGRFIIGEFTGDFMGETFTGTSIMGYDNVEQRVQNVWMDSWTSGIYMSTGEMAKDGKSMSSTGVMRMNSPKAGKISMVQREVIKVTSPDTYVMEMYHSGGANGDSLKAMEITYTRRK